MIQVLEVKLIFVCCKSLNAKLISSYYILYSVPSTLIWASYFIGSVFFLLDESNTASINQQRFKYILNG
jgi:hypothetical protein